MQVKYLKKNTFSNRVWLNTSLVTFQLMQESLRNPLDGNQLKLVLSI